MLMDLQTKFDVARKFNFFLFFFNWNPALPWYEMGSDCQWENGRFSCYPLKKKQIYICHRCLHPKTHACAGNMLNIQLSGCLSRQAEKCFIFRLNFRFSDFLPRRNTVCLWHEILFCNIRNKFSAWLHDISNIERINIEDTFAWWILRSLMFESLIFRTIFHFHNLTAVLHWSSVWLEANNTENDCQSNR